MPTESGGKRLFIRDYGLELHILEREEIITQMMMPENASLRASFLHLDIDAEPQVADFIERTRRAADAVTQTWALRTKGLPLIELTSVRLDPDGAESTDILSLAQIDLALSQSRRVVLEGPAGGGKTTVLVQLAQSVRTAGIPFIIELPAWVSSRRPILEYIAGMPAFQAESLTPANLALVQQTEPFLLLLNGWNEITASNSEEAVSALRELERDFPRAGIIVATRTHYLAPPLPGALRLRLLRLRRDQRAAYLTERFGEKGEDFRARLDADPSLDELTRTPFILSEVGSLFEVDAEIPSTKIGVLAQVLHLQEQRDEHRNALQVAPILGLHTDYLKALATEMTRRGAIALAEADARAVAAAVVRGLVSRGQIESTGAPSVLAMLSAHHILERVDYPQSVFQFEHQQLQEYYATIDVRIRLLDLQDEDREATDHFITEYVNDPAWAEPLRMIAETFAEQTGDVEIDNRNIRAGGRLVDMVLAVDPVFAGELAKLCGEAVWNDISAVVGNRFRAIYAIHDSNYQQYALAAMLATGSDDFCDIILPILSGQDKQTRLRTYHLWPDIQVSSLGSNWCEQVHGWSEGAQADFVSQLLHYRTDDEIVAFAVDGVSSIVKKAAVSGLIWTGSEAALTRVLESMDAQTFEDAVNRNADLMPVALRPKIVSAMHKFIKGSTDHSARLRTALHLIEFGETGLDDVLKDSMAELDGDALHNLWPHIIHPGLEYLHKIDPVWTSEWVANQVGEGGALLA